MSLVECNLSTIEISILFRIVYYYKEMPMRYNAGSSWVIEMFEEVNIIDSNKTNHYYTDDIFYSC